MVWKKPGGLTWAASKKCIPEGGSGVQPVRGRQEGCQERFCQEAALFDGPLHDLVRCNFDPYFHRRSNPACFDMHHEQRARAEQERNTSGA